MMVVRAWQRRSRWIKRDTFALYLAVRDPRTPWMARVLAGAVVAYALSPIDLIPDFIPVLGSLDDLIIVPLGLSVCLKLIPPEVMEESRARADVVVARSARIVGLVVVAIWAALIVLVAYIAARAFGLI